MSTRQLRLVNASQENSRSPIRAQSTYAGKASGLYELLYAIVAAVCSALLPQLLEGFYDVCMCPDRK